ncbi:flagellar motor protein MotB [Salinisphaera aquimarina]|uniref:Flagellar motor protein MotB n=1 Tax=Salinisphaera aquimarina TaxID=2094031 RepID=A0ABV7EN51_9GAMM
MSEQGSRRPIIVKRKRPTAHQGSHGTWKIAYADFMTAMMAFFLVMWLLGGLSKAEMAEVSEYFRTPLSVALVGGDRNTASNSAIPGGGDDPIHSDGEVALTRRDATNYTVDRNRLSQLKQRLESLIHEDPALNAMSSQLKIEMVHDGLRIQIFDDRNKPMFQIGSARIEPYVRELLIAIAPRLDRMPNKITLTGHTDDLRYAGGAATYSNWELSSDRANAARRALVAAGYAPDKLLRVIGAAATERVPGDGPGAPANRRISILVLNAEAQERIETEGHAFAPSPSVPAGRSADAPRQAVTPPVDAAPVLSLFDGMDLFVHPFRAHGLVSAGF